eukprot:1106540-Rhodomonas_salina.1
MSEVCVLRLCLKCASVVCRVSYLDDSADAVALKEGCTAPNANVRGNKCKYAWQNLYLFGLDGGGFMESRAVLAVKKVCTNTPTKIELFWKEPKDEMLGGCAQICSVRC